MTAPDACGCERAGVRWDAVVAPRVLDVGDAVPLLPQSGSNQSAHSIQIHVQLFGSLAALCAERSAQFDLPAGATIADALVRTEERLGVPLLTHVLDEAGAKRRHCRLFVGGYAVEDLQTPLQGTTDPTEIDIILLIAPEGG